MRIKKFYLFLCFYLLSQFGFTQNQIEIFEFINSIYNLDFKTSISIAKKNKDPLKTKLTLLCKIIEDNGFSELNSIDKRIPNLNFNKTDDIDQYLCFLIKGYENLYYTKNRQQSYFFFNKALVISKKINAFELEKFSIFSLLKFYLNGVLQGTKDYAFYLDLYKKMCVSKTDWIHFYSFKFNLLGQTETYNEKTTNLAKASKKIFEKYDSIIESDDISRKIHLLYYRDKANDLIRTNPDKAKELFDKSKSYFDNSNFFKKHFYVYHCNLSRVFSLKKDYTKGLESIKNAEKHISFNDSLIYTYYLKIYKSNLFFNLKQYDSAYIYEKDVRYLNYEINFQKENQNVSEFRTKLNSAEKEKENIQLKSEKIENRNYLIASLLSLFLISIIGFLIIKNSKKKRILAQQQKEIETQKNLNLIKEQEITSINAMVVGQEKERKQIAEDLHDNLGSVLATLKLHFDNLKINREKQKINQEELFNKTENLIDEAYLKVRSIAHAKNAGVIANQGLLIGVKMMAEKIASADKINIDVIDFGLDKRLENSLEITLFRIIQELTTNVLKHAEAKNLTINIAQFKENLNIIIEDDGKGFDIDKVNFTNAMGLSSIKTRIKHLRGSFDVDATPGKGSSVILNIPIT